MSQLTSSQIEAFADSLVKNGIIDKSDERLEISQSRDGLAVVQYVSNIVGGPNSNLVGMKEAVNARNAVYFKTKRAKTKG